MMDEPGSFSGKINSPKPQRGPDPNQRTSLANFIKAQANVFNAPLEKTNASCAANAANLFGAVIKGNPVNRAIFSADFSPNLGCALIPVPTALPTSANSYNPGNVVSIFFKAACNCAI